MPNTRGGSIPKKPKAFGGIATARPARGLTRTTTCSAARQRLAELESWRRCMSETEADSPTTTRPPGFSACSKPWSRHLDSTAIRRGQLRLTNWSEASAPCSAVSYWSNGLRQQTARHRRLACRCGLRVAQHTWGVVERLGFGGLVIGGQRHRAMLGVDHVLVRSMALFGSAENSLVSLESRYIEADESDLTDLCRR